MWNFIEQHPGAIGAVVSILAILIKTSRWGKARGDALDSIVDVITRHGSNDLKDAINKQSGDNQSHASQAALFDAKQRANPEMPDPDEITIAARESARMFSDRLAKTTSNFLSRHHSKDD